MALFTYINCVACGKRIKVSGTKCSECGCPILKSMDKSETIYADPNEKIEIHVSAETQKLIEMLTPAIADRNKTEEVSSKVRNYIQTKYESSLHSDYCIFKPIGHVLDQSIKQREYNRKQADFNARIALNTYKRQMEQPVKGLGFSIITNDFISAASYLALSAYDAKKQLVSMEANAKKTLTDNLRQINSDNSMYESEVFNLLTAVGDAMRYAVWMAQAKQFISSHLGFYTDQKKYDLSKTIQGINVYEFVTSSVARSHFVGSYKPHDNTANAQAAAMESAGYIHILGAGSYITTTKLERETLREVYYTAHPEERAKAQQKQQAQKAQLYLQARQDLRTGRYYEAALNFEKADGYQNALAHSLRIWDTHILSRKWIRIDLRCACAQREDGTVCFAGKQGNNRVPEEQFLREISQWKNIAQLELIQGMPFGLQENGSIITHLETVSSVNTSIYGNGTNWRYITEISGDTDHHLVGIHSNGRVSAVGTNDNGQCNVSGWTDVIKVATDTNVTMGLTKNGTVLIAGKSDLSGQNYQSWRNIVDISVSYYAAVGLTNDGRIKAIGTEAYVAETSAWHDIRKAKAIKECIIGFTNEGKLLYAGHYSLDKAYLEMQENVVDVVLAGPAIGEKSSWLVLHADGTVSATQVHYDISGWNNLVSVGGTQDWAYGVKRDGSIVFAGKGRYDEGGLQQLSGWKLFTDINAVENNPKERMIKNIKDSIYKEIEICQKELSGLTGLFTGKKRRELESKIQQLKASL